MRDYTKIKEQFHYFNIQSNIDTVYGNWAVSKDGDVVNYLYPFAILAVHFNEKNWVEELKNKIWFKPRCEDSLMKALERANEIVNKK